MEKINTKELRGKLTRKNGKVCRDWQDENEDDERRMASRKNVLLLP